MEIDTGDSPPITQKPYTLALKHAKWVQKELEILEKAGVIVRIVSPWASPIVVVPKRTAPGEPPKRRLCADYRAINSLLPPVKKAFSKAKGILTLVPWPKIDEIYACLKDSKIYSTFDMQSGYYHMVLSEKSRPKSAFVSAYGKWEFKRCLFGLAQAPAYFQRLVNKVLSGLTCLTFAFAYLDDILIFNPDMETHLKHLRVLFERLRSADLKLKEVKCKLPKETCTIFGTYYIRRRYSTHMWKIGQYTENVAAMKSQRSKTILRTHRILQKICTPIFRFSKTSQCLNMKEYSVWVDTDLSGIFWVNKSLSDDRIHFDLPWSKSSLCVIHRCK